MNDVRLSKFLSYVLRHHPESAGLTLDANGWSSVEEVLAAARRQGLPLNRARLERIVAENDKQRFALSGDGVRIRAHQGHSVEVDLALEPRDPPEFLFHGTVMKFWDSIQRDGLRPGSRHHVHLSPDEATARRVGARRGKPFILRIRAQAMAKSGHLFYCSANGVWLTGHVPPLFLEPIEPEP